MSGLTGLPAVPWRFVDHAMVKMWLWRTEHFEAKVTADLNSFSWEISDLVQPMFLAEGRAGDFSTAEREVREVIGKSYPSRLGYGAYAGPLATTFALASGERVDLGAFAGQRAVVTVRLPSGGTQVLVGHVKVVHYALHVTPDSGATVAVQPAHIDRIVGEGGGIGARPSGDTHTGVGRIYRGEMVRGCTGKPGFMPETVDHHGNPCPVHESNQPRVASIR